MNLNEIKQVLARDKIQLTKSLGQNFLHDANQLRRIVAAGELVESDRVLEIGPGLGALTHLILEKVPHLLAIEKDRRLFDYLRRQLPDEQRLTLLHADALKYLHTESIDWSAWKMVANLPYSVASSILVEFAKMPNPPGRLVLTLQWEVAQRLAATARQDAYGVLTLLVQLRYELHAMFKMPATSFFPEPEIDSACVTMIKRAVPLVEPSQFRAFEKIVKRGFSQRRKMMMKLLKADWPLEKLEEAFVELGLSPQARAETVTLPQYVELTNRLALPAPTPASAP